MDSKRTKSKIRVAIVHEPFGFPESPFGIYELIRMQDGFETFGQELARAGSRKEALQLIRKYGWEY